MFTEHLKCPGVLPLHEAFYFDQVTSLRQHLAPSPRAAVQTALSNPNWYFRKKCREDVTPNSKMPGICTIYQLHLECGRLINLYDWLQVSTLIYLSIIVMLKSLCINFLQSFITIMEPESADKEDAKKETVNPLLQYPTHNYQVILRHVILKILDKLIAGHNLFRLFRSSSYWALSNPLRERLIMFRDSLGDLVNPLININFLYHHYLDTCSGYFRILILAR